MLNQQQGFSLVEILIALLLVTTLILSLIQQQQQSMQMMKQLVLHEQAVKFLARTDEVQAVYIHSFVSRMNNEKTTRLKLI